MRLAETFEQGKFKEGQVKFSKTTFDDPHIVKALTAIASVRSVPIEQVIEEVKKKMAKIEPLKAKAPTLYHTIADNIVEGEVFGQFEKLHIDLPDSPKFSKVEFRKLCLRTQAEQSRFFPLRSFVEKRRHENPSFVFVDDPDDPNSATGKSPWGKVPTAAATPKGEFIFNVKFCQKLLDWAHVKGLKPKGKKYVANGGDIPNEYAYIEFLIMHEFLHYSEADFYYHKIIPDSNHEIMNWVGDFRSNYLLVKSGYEQLPIGLFNDKVNYDRQKTYREMYDIVKKEFDSLPPPPGGKGDGKDIPIEPGMKVRMPNGKKGTVTAVHGDGRVDVEEDPE